MSEVTPTILTVGERERATQDRVIALFEHALGYEYLGDWSDRPENSNIEESLLRPFLVSQGYNDVIITKAIHELKKVAWDQSKTLYDTNKAVYTMLRYGIKVRPDVSENNITVHLINWNEPLKNLFAIAEEVTVIGGEHTKRPDIVIYINGIALGVIELKKCTVSVSEGIRQNLDNQSTRFIKEFFSTIQLVMAGNDTEGLRYGTIETPEKYYLTWKEEGGPENILDKHILQIAEKTRLLDIIHNFIVFDSGIKKLARTHQYFGIKKTQEYLRRKEGGIIWHTQWSGKSLTMVWLAKWIRENLGGQARVLVITDRTELDKQIAGVFKGVDESIHRTKSGADLIEKLNGTTHWLICSLVHKFGSDGVEKEELTDKDMEAFIEELKKSLPRDFRAKWDIYVFVDECHRSQSGKLHDAMKIILPDAVFIGFTGTPLLKTEKQTSLEVWGRYIHTYKFDEAVRDEVVLDLRYEARNIDQKLTSPEKVDQWFEAKTRGLTDYARVELKKKWWTMQRVLSARSRLERIVSDIMLDMETKPRLMDGRGNAILVAGSIYQACRYYELFQNAWLKKCAIVTSYAPNAQDIKWETVGNDENTEKLEQYEIYQKMLWGKKVEDFEDEVKAKFIDEPGQMRLLIVVDKLLTGFDAPPATYLYIDKNMQDHGLFQAICRVNRLDGDDKEYGYIIDYKDLFKSLETAMDDFTSEAFDTYDKEDVAWLLTDRLVKWKEDLDEALETLRALCEPVPLPRDTTAFIKFFCGHSDDIASLTETKERRYALYKHTSHLIRAYADIAGDMVEAGYTQSEASSIRNEVKYYEDIRQSVKLASGDYIDLKMYEPAMRHLIDNYISAEESKKISAFDNMSLVELLVRDGASAMDTLPEDIKKSEEAMAETIENNLRKVIIEERPTNPKYFDEMSRLLTELIEERRKDSKNYKRYLDQIVELSKKIRKPTGTYPTSLINQAMRSIYDNLGKDEGLTILVDKTIMEAKQDSWIWHHMREKAVKIALKQVLTSTPDDEFDTLMELIKNQPQYR